MKSVALVLLATAAACGPSDRTRPGGNGNGVDGGNNGGSNGGSGNEDGCSDSAKLVYTVAMDNTFSQFDPSTKTFKDLGPLQCDAGGAQPFSMGVDRNTIAWVLYDNGQLFRVDINNNLACTPTAWSSQQGLTQFGMGFSTDAAGGDTDTLYVAGGAAVSSGNASLATLDTTNFTATPKGPITGWPELTGTGAAELWGWFPSNASGTSTPHVDKIDKMHGTSLQSFPLSMLKGMPTAWAFAFWGGDFWIFLAKDLDFETTVYQLDGQAGTIKGMTSAGGRVIVGAGVSTCAPIVIQ